CDRGTSYGDYGPVLRAQGVPREVIWSYPASTNVCTYSAPPKPVLDEAARLRVTQTGFQLYRVFLRGAAGSDGSTADAHRRIVAAVSEKQLPLLVSVNVPSQWN